MRGVDCKSIAKAWKHQSNRAIGNVFSLSLFGETLNYMEEDHLSQADPLNTLRAIA
jgi:hypothetical protein